jgi:hypothetical protein
MPSNFVPTRESLLVTFTNNFSEQLTAKFAQVGRLATDATAFAALNTVWANAYSVAIEPVTRTKSTVAAKNAAKRACVAKLRELSALIQKFSGTTDALRADFGLNPPKQRSPIGIPTEIPKILVFERVGEKVYIRLLDASDRRTMPVGVQGARVFTYVGPTPPASVDDWRNEGQTTRSEVELEFNNVPAGSTVWVTAAYYNPRGQLGTACNPISTVIAGGALQIAA